MPTKSSYQKRLDENTELIKKNKELKKKIEEMQKAVDILNDCIYKMSTITGTNDIDLQKQADELFEEMEQDGKETLEQ